MHGQQNIKIYVIVESVLYGIFALKISESIENYINFLHARYVHSTGIFVLLT